jgi:nitrate/nitrite transporter NarK
MWNTNNTAPHMRRATSTALMAIMGNFGGILATWLLGVLSPAPRYFLASEVLLSFSVLMFVFFISNTLFLWDQNRKKSKIRRTKSPNEEKADLGDQSAWFIYHL